MSFDALNSLRAAGNPVDQLSEAQRAVLATLKEDEVAVLVSVQQRLRAVEGDDVEGHDLKMM